MAPLLPVINCESSYPLWHLLRLPRDLIFVIFAKLPVLQVMGLSLTCKSIRQIVHDNQLWKRLFLREMPSYIIADYPGKFLESEAELAYRQILQIDRNMRHGFFKFSTMSAVTSSPLTYFGLGFRQIYTGYQNGTIKVWNSSDVCQDLDGHTGRIYFIDSTDEHLFTASEDGLLQIWTSVMTNSLKWLQTQYIGQISSLTINKQGIYEQTSQAIQIWKRYGPHPLFQTLKPLPGKQGNFRVTDDLFFHNVHDKGLEIWKKDTCIQVLEGVTKAFWVIGPYLCRTVIEIGLEIYKYSGNSFQKIKILPIRDDIADIDVLGDFLCIRYQHTSALDVLNPLENFKLVKTLEGAIDYNFLEDHLFALQPDQVTEHIWEQRGNELLRTQILSYSTPVDRLLIYGPFLFILTQGTIIQLWFKEEEFQFKHTLRSEGPPIEELLFRGGLLVAKTADNKLEIWNFKS